jgi:hypothetical protein
MRRSLSFLAASTLALGAALGGAAPATADSLVLPAGVACADFDLGIAIDGAAKVERTFTDRDGNVVRTLSAGTGAALTFTNLDTDATFATTSNGSVTHTTINADGTTTTSLTGHNILILFPTDVPPGPSTGLYVGRVTLTINTTTGVYTVLQTSGWITDICAQLSA